MKIILSSNSPRRRELLAGLGVDFEVKVIKGVDESYPDTLPSKDVAEYIAREKAAAYEVADDELVITADTVVIVGDDILGADDDDDLGLVFQLQQHLQLGVRLKARQHAGSVVVIKQLAAKLQVELVVKLGDPLPDMRRLHGKVFVVVKSYFHR